jgi:hypothetical protein
VATSKPAAIYTTLTDVIDLDQGVPLRGGNIHAHGDLLDDTWEAKQGDTRSALLQPD